MNHLVQITAYEGGDYVPIQERMWCLLIQDAGTMMAFCSNQVIGEGEGDATFKLKERQRGGITCPACLAKIKEIKKVRL